MSLGRLGRRLRALVHGRRADRETAEELKVHLEMAVEELVASGVEPGEARRQARLRLGSPDSIREAARDERGARWLEDAAMDLRLAARQLARSPGFAVVAVATLAIGVGATAAIVGVVDGVLLRPSPFERLDRLVMVWETDRDSGTEHEPSAWPDYVDFAERSRTLSGLAAVVGRDLSYRPSGGDPERVSAVAASATYLPLVGLRPTLGSFFDQADERPGAGRVVVLGEAFWRRRLAADPDVLGRPITLDGETYSIRGVVPAGADFGLDQIHARAAYHAPYSAAGEVDLWLPLQASAETFPRSTHPFLVLGRLAPGVELESARAELGRIARDLEIAYPDSNAARGTFVEPLDEVIYGPIRPTLLLFSVAAALVLAAACLSVSNLLLARAATRSAEVAVRSSLGAGAGRLARQFLVESALLASMGAVLGVAVAEVVLRLLVAAAPGDVPRLDAVRIDGRVLLASLGVAVAVTLLVGALPTLHALRARLTDALRGGERGATAGPSVARFRRVLVGAELALAVTLLLAAGLLGRSFWTLLEVDPGFRTDGVIKAEYNLPESRYPRDYRRWPRWTEVHDFHHRLLERARAIPGVTAAAVAGAHPLDPGFTNSFVVVGREAEAADWPEIRVRLVSPEYFEVVGVDVLEGRGLAESDATDGPPVAVLNRRAADRFFPGSDPIGHEIRFWGTSRRIVGVVEDELLRGLDAPAPIAVYAPTAQAPRSAVVLVRADGDPARLAAPLRAALRAADPELSVFGEEPLDATLRSTLTRRRFALAVLGAFAATTLFLALVGIYGVTSHAVTERRHELGLRAALGASRGQLIGLVVHGGLEIALAGVAVGLVVAFAASRLLRSLLYGVSALDPGTYLAVPALLLAATAAVTALPAWRAARADPARALRHD